MYGLWLIWLCNLHIYTYTRSKEYWGKERLNSSHRSSLPNDYRESLPALDRHLTNGYISHHLDNQTSHCQSSETCLLEPQDGFVPQLPTSEACMSWQARVAPSLMTGPPTSHLSLPAHPKHSRHAEGSCILFDLFLYFCSVSECATTGRNPLPAVVFLASGLWVSASKMAFLLTSRSITPAAVSNPPVCISMRSRRNLSECVQVHVLPSRCTELPLL